MSSAVGVWGPAPDGVDLSHNQNGDIIGAVIAVMVIGFAAVALRVFARVSRAGPGLGRDDYVVFIALILGIGNAVCCLISVQWGGGKHLWVVSQDEFTKLWQTTYAFVIVYINSITATKSSILLYYHRLFGTTPAWYIVFGFTVAHGLEVTITWLSGCRPVSYFWNQYIDPSSSGSCIDASVFYFINGIIGMVIDISILLVPIPSIYRLRMPMRQKLLVCSILLLGSFVCVASIVRIVMMNKLVHSKDFTWAMCQVFIWSCVEPFIGILCACLPTYAPLVRYWTRSTATSQQGNARRVSSYHISSGSAKPSKRFRGHMDSLMENTVQGCDDIELTADAGTHKNGEGYSYKVHTDSKSQQPARKQDILVRTDFSFSHSA